MGCFRPPTASSVNPEPKGKDKAPLAPETPDTVVLLADCSLLELPLEALTMFDSPNIAAMSRDVSLQMLYHRFHEEQLTRKCDFLFASLFSYQQSLLQGELANQRAASLEFTLPGLGGKR